MKTVGVIGFAFGQHPDGSAGVSNERIARLLSQRRNKEQARGNVVLLGTQWEVATAFRTLGTPELDCVVSQYGDPATEYLTTEQVLRASLSYFDTRGVDEVIFVGHPLHIVIIRLLLLTGVWRLDGGTTGARHRIVSRSLDYVPYDKSPGNAQWWTRSTWPFLRYLVGIALTRRHGDQQHIPPAI